MVNNVDDDSEKEKYVRNAKPMNCLNEDTKVV